MLYPTLLLLLLVIATLSTASVAIIARRRTLLARELERRARKLEHKFDESLQETQLLAKELDYFRSHERAFRSRSEERTILILGLPGSGKTSLTRAWLYPNDAKDASPDTPPAEKYRVPVALKEGGEGVRITYFNILDHEGEKNGDALTRLVDENVEGLILVVELGSASGGVSEPTELWEYRRSGTVSTEQIRDQIEQFSNNTFLSLLASSKLRSRLRSIVIFINKVDILTSAPQGELKRIAEEAFQPLIKRMRSRLDRVHVVIGSATHGLGTQMVLAHLRDDLLDGGSFRRPDGLLPLLASGSPATELAHVAPSPSHNLVEALITLDASLHLASAGTLMAIVEELQASAADPTMRLRNAREGSVVLELDMTEEGYRVLVALFKAGQLREVCGVPVVAVRRADDVSRDASQSTLPDPDLASRKLIVVAYCRKDSLWKDRLAAHLSAINRKGTFDFWDDRRIPPGSTWHSEVASVTARAHAAVLLVSADYLSSPFATDAELSGLLRRRSDDGMMLFPLLVRPCAWKAVDWLASRSMRPRDEKSLSVRRPADADQELARFAEEIATFLAAG